MRVEDRSTAIVGMPLRDVGYGTVVMRPVIPPVYYLVASPMDGTGRRVLVTLGSGTTKEVAQDTLVIPVAAHVVVGER